MNPRRGVRESVIFTSVLIQQPLKGSFVQE